MVSVTFYGGVGEIGGNKILLETSEVRLFLDFGMSFGRRNLYYSEPFLKPRGYRDLLEFKILPKLEGVYKFDSLPPSIDAVFLTHAHLDHSAYISFLKREIPVYCGDTTRTILVSTHAVRPKNFETDISGVEFHPFRTGDRISIGDVEIEPIHVDHSVPGAYGFIIYTPEGVIVYTGDLRTHGIKRELSLDFLAKAKEVQPLALITEGTNMTEAYVSSEEEIKEKLVETVSQISGLVLVQFASTDVDRLRTFWEVSKRTKRLLALTFKQAYLLWMLQKDPHLEIPSLDDATLLIYEKKKKVYADWENNLREFFTNVVESNKLSSMQRDVILVCGFYDLKELIDINPIPGSTFILSCSEPFSEELELDYKKLLNWLDHYGLPEYRIHVSGHIMPLSLKKAIKEINPKVTFPIHTERPKIFKKFLEDVGTEVKIVEEGLRYELKG